MTTTSNARLGRARRALCATVPALVALIVSAPLRAWAADAAASGLAATPPTYAVLSLIGDEFSVITRRVSAESRIDNNDKRVFPVADALFDRTAMAAAEAALSQARPGAPVLRFSIRDARLFALQSAVLADTPESGGLRAALVKLLHECGATQLVLITKRRDDANFKFVESSIGIGKLSGLGFYIDPMTPNYRVDTGEHAAGYVAPFAYIDVALVDVDSMRVVKSAPALESSMTTDAGKSDTFRAWDALTGQQKVDALERLIRRGVGAALQSALAG